MYWCNWQHWERAGHARIVVVGFIGTIVVVLVALVCFCAVSLPTLEPIGFPVFIILLEVSEDGNLWNFQPLHTWLQSGFFAISSRLAHALSRCLNFIYSVSISSCCQQMPEVSQCSWGNGIFSFSDSSTKCKFSHVVTQKQPHFVLWKFIRRERERINVCMCPHVNTDMQIPYLLHLLSAFEASWFVLVTDIWNR